MDPPAARVALPPMPVMVTHAQSAAGRAAVRALRRSGGELRVWLDAEVATDDDAAAFRGLGCKVAAGTMDDEGRLELAFEQVHTVVHLGGGPLEEPEEVLEDAAQMHHGVHLLEGQLQASFVVHG